MSSHFVQKSAITKRPIVDRTNVQAPKSPKTSKKSSPSKPVVVIAEGIENQVIQQVCDRHRFFTSVDKEEEQQVELLVAVRARQYSNCS